MCVTMWTARTIATALRWAGSLAALGLLAACGFGNGHPAAAAHAPLALHAAAHKETPAARELAGMVDAVGPSRSHAPINVKFAIRARPQVGQNVEIDYAVIPEVPGLQSLRVGFGSLKGLTVVSHDSPVAAIKPASGVPIFGSVAVRPDTAGLFTLTAAVAVESADRTVIWDFSIPVIAEQGGPQTAAN
jgi:hypothetical protein